jgi:hypothetical protein
VRTTLKLLLILVALPLLALGQDQAAAGNSGQALAARAQEILQKAREALGGEANLKAIQSLTASGNFRGVMQRRPVSGQIKFELLGADKYMKTTTTAMGMMEMKLIEAVNGSEAWTDRKMSSSPMGGGMGEGGGGFGSGGGTGGGEGGGGGFGGGGGGRGGGGRGGGGIGGGGMGGAPGGGAQRMPEITPQMQAMMEERARAEYSRLFTAWLLTAPATTLLEFSYEKELDVQDGKADAVRVTGANDFIMWLIVDQKTHRPLLVTYREARQARPTADAEEAARQAQATDIQLYLRDYKQVNNVWLPHQIVKASNGQMMEEWKLKYKLNPNLKPKQFEKPQKKN